MQALELRENCASKFERVIAPRRRRVSMRLVAGIVSFSLGVGLAELTLRLFWTPPAPERTIHTFDIDKTLQRDAELGFVPRASVVVDYPPFNARFETNSGGMRGPEISVARDPARRRIVVLGDSFAWGHGVSTGKAFPEIIDAELPDTDVINLGVPGYELSRELAYFNRDGRKYNPDLIVVAVCQNDIRDDETNNTSVPASSARDAGHAIDSPPPVARRFKKWLRANSYLFTLIQQTVNTNKTLASFAVTIGLKEELAGYEMLDDNLRPALFDPPPTVERARRRVVDDLLAIRDAAQDAGADLIVVLIPCIQAVDRRELLKSIAYTRYEAGDFDLDLPMNLIETACGENGIRVVNPLAEFRAAFNQGADLYLPGDLHFNTAGHALFATTILNAIAKSKAGVEKARISDSIFKF